MPDVYLPTLHPGQVEAYMMEGRFKAVRCGRRWGKTDLAITEGGDAAAKREFVGYFAPDYKIMSETFNAFADILAPIRKASNKTDGVFRTTTGGRIDFWSLENERAGRSRRYHLVIVDEAAFTKNKTMMKIWQQSIMPTLLDYKGRALILSNTNGSDPENFFWRICNEPEHGFVEYHAPSSQNPYLPAEEIERLRVTQPPLVFAQEYLAEFVDWAGVQFFELEKMLVDGQPVPWPAKCDLVFATIDTALKDGKEHDATAVSFWAFNRIQARNIHRLVLLDWDIVQIEGASLAQWLPGVFQHLESLGRQTGARLGSQGAYIEDKNSGTILLQHGRSNNWPVHAIDSKLTSIGKDGRAFAVSAHIYQGLMKISQPAYDKTKIFKGQSRNHWLSQVLGFRVGMADGQPDDALDTMTYGVAIALGDEEGF